MLPILAAASAAMDGGVGGVADEGGHQLKPELEAAFAPSRDDGAQDLILLEDERDDDGAPLLPRDLDRQLVRSARLAALDPDDGIVL